MSLNDQIKFSVRPFPRVISKWDAAMFHGEGDSGGSSGGGSEGGGSEGGGGTSDGEGGSGDGEGGGNA